MSYRGIFDGIIYSILILGIIIGLYNHSGGIWNLLPMSTYHY